MSLDSVLLEPFIFTGGTATYTVCSRYMQCISFAYILCIYTIIFNIYTIILFVAILLLLCSYTVTIV